ncbi:sulfatase-like hydrolase/transferase [Aestuariivivens sediminis]|uniref:sulfatase-like hydrolase/transferase n=1 Tax=Aestuariivivens sediminis TaxID=2913557 RepID=UPI001F598EED|nr:sulfatase-like hydrolase/transferase [Aestuariivivens sediminis]
MINLAHVKAYDDTKMTAHHSIPSGLWGIAILASLCLGSCHSQTKDNPPPNIIIFLVDDMGLMDTSVPFLTDANGRAVTHPLNDYYRTPHMKTLSEQGIRFSNFYAHSVCSPTRTTILTGQNSARHGVTNWIKSENNNRGKYGPPRWNWNGLTKASVTLPKILQQAGYKTIHVGKAHFGPFRSAGEDPMNLGFDVNIAGSSIGQPGSYLGTEAFGHTGGNKNRAVPGLEKYHGQDIFLTEALTLEANKAISRAKAEGKPFFLHMAHYAVHAPFYSDSRFAGHYKDSGKSEKAQAYATLIEGIDKSLGDIIQHVNDLGLGKNTLIFFLGDNGSDAPLPIEKDYSSASPLKGKKGNHWEGGMRVPFIASWVTPDKTTPRQKEWPIAPHAIQQQMGSVMDLFPTLCQVANLSWPQEHIVDGFTLKEQLKGEEDRERNESFLNHYPHKHRTSYFTSLVQSNWKIIYHYPITGPPQYELFNLTDDPFETHNLADTKPKMLKKMMQLMADELQQKGALYPEKDGQALPLIMPEMKINTTPNEKPQN